MAHFRVKWQRLAARARRRGRLLGVDASAFPSDFTVFARSTRALRSLPPIAVPDPLSVEDALTGLAADPHVTVVG